jgi:hypothetical protein
MDPDQQILKKDFRSGELGNVCTGTPEECHVRTEYFDG